MCLTEEKLDVSGSSRSLINVQLCSMCYAREISVVQSCTLLGPCGTGAWPLTQGTPTPLLSVWPLETQSTSSPQQGWIWTRENKCTKKPRQPPHPRQLEALWSSAAVARILSPKAGSFGPPSPQAKIFMTQLEVAPGGFQDSEDFNVLAQMGKVTVTPLQSHITSHFLQ